MSIKHTTKPCRLAYPVLFTPEANQVGKLKYSAVLIFEHEDTAEIRAAIHEAAVEKWGADRSKWPGNLKNMDFQNYLSMTGKDGFPLRDGDSVSWKGCEGKAFIKVSTNGDGPKARPPFIVDRKREAVIDKSEVFGGLVVRASLAVSAYDVSGSRGISAYINGLQILKDDGTRIGGFSSADAFDEWTDEDDLF